MHKLILYGLDASPPVRACLLTLKALELPFQYVIVNPLKGEHRTAEYTAKNPQCTVPTLEDDGHYIWDSHAIMAYLVSKYAKDDVLYPKDLLQRAVVDQRLHFETGIVFEDGLRSITAPLFFRNVTTVPQYKLDNILKVYELLEIFLKKHIYMAGDVLTIADFSIISTVSSLVGLIGIDEAKYPKLSQWIERIKELSYYEEANGKGARIICQMIKSYNLNIV